MHLTQGSKHEMKQTAPLREGFWQRLKRNKLTPVGAYLIVLIFLICLLTPFLPLIDPDETDLTVRLETPFNLRHWLGTDELGRDLFLKGFDQQLIGSQFLSVFYLE